MMVLRWEWRHGEYERYKSSYISMIFVSKICDIFLLIFIYWLAYVRMIFNVQTRSNKRMNNSEFHTGKLVSQN